jgi:hypothetical protein
MSFSYLGADEYRLIYRHSRHWPGFWQTCTSTYRWIKETWAIERCLGKPLSLSCFSDHVFSEPDYARALAVTPPFPFCHQKDLLSRSLIAHMIAHTEADPECPRRAGETKQTACFKVLEDFECCAKQWVGERGLIVPRCSPDDHFWVFVAYEAAVMGRRSTVSKCLSKMRGDGVTAAICLEFLARVYKCHNTGHDSTHPRKLFVIPRPVAFPRTLTMQQSQLKFNESIYLALQHKDPAVIKYVIKNVQIDLLGVDEVDRWTIKELARKPGMEHCLKVLKDYDFF